MTLEQTLPRTAEAHQKLLQPDWAEVISIQKEINDVATLVLRFQDPEIQKAYRFAPGQFNMLYLPGYGEVAISISSDMTDRSSIAHTVRFVGNVTRAASRLRPGDIVGLRGPFGSAWPTAELQGKDLFIACGGIGLPPLRPTLYHVIRNRAKYGKVTVLYGARTPSELMYTREYDAWRQAGIDLEITVDRAEADWTGRVGVVPMWFYQFRIDPRKTAVLTCGPEIMIRFVIFEALARRIAPENIYVSLERNMKCGQGACGHCQIGPYFICKDGPVFPFSVLQPFFNVEEF
ncbi:MAG TPA: FAD/NAD(P)-binding protein [Anaerolineales bacterium]